MKPLCEREAFCRTFASSQETAAPEFRECGLRLLTSQALIFYLEQASCDALLPYLDASEVSVGVGLDLVYLDFAAVGTPIEVLARITEVSRNKIVFAVEARAGERKLIEGTHLRAVIPAAKLARKEESAG